MTSAFALQDVLEIFGSPDYRLRRAKEGLEVGVRLACPGTHACTYTGNVHSGIVIKGTLIIQGRERWVLEEGSRHFFLDLDKYDVVPAVSLPEELSFTQRCDFRIGEELNGGGPTSVSVTTELVKKFAVSCRSKLARSLGCLRARRCGECCLYVFDGERGHRDFGDYVYFSREVAGAIRRIQQGGQCRCGAWYRHNLG